MLSWRKVKGTWSVKFNWSKILKLNQGLKIRFQWQAGQASWLDQNSLWLSCCRGPKDQLYNRLFLHCYTFWDLNLWQPVRLSRTMIASSFATYSVLSFFLQLSKATIDTTTSHFKSSLNLNPWFWPFLSFSICSLLFSSAVTIHFLTPLMQLYCPDCHGSLP